MTVDARRPDLRRDRYCDVALGTADLDRTDRCHAGLPRPTRSPTPCRRGSGGPAASPSTRGLGGRPDLGSAQAVSLGRAGVVAEEVALRRDMQRVGHRRLVPPRSALACALVVMPVAAMCLSWQEPLALAPTYLERG